MFALFKVRAQCAMCLRVCVVLKEKHKTHSNKDAECVTWKRKEHVSLFDCQ